MGFLWYSRKERGGRTGLARHDDTIRVKEQGEEKIKKDEKKTHRHPHTQHCHRHVTRWLFRGGGKGRRTGDKAGGRTMLRGTDGAQAPSIRPAVVIAMECSGRQRSPFGPSLHASYFSFPFFSVPFVFCLLLESARETEADFVVAEPTDRAYERWANEARWWRR